VSPTGYDDNIPYGGIVFEETYRKKESLFRLKRIEDQVRGLQKMIEREAGCADILTQVAAVTGP